MQLKMKMGDPDCPEHADKFIDMARMPCLETGIVIKIFIFDKNNVS